MFMGSVCENEIWVLCDFTKERTIKIKKLFSSPFYNVFSLVVRQNHNIRTDML